MLLPAPLQCAHVVVEKVGRLVICFGPRNRSSPNGEDQTAILVPYSRDHFLVEQVVQTFLKSGPFYSEQ
jgi:hypothetical protein